PVNTAVADDDAVGGGVHALHLRPLALVGGQHAEFGERIAVEQMRNAFPRRKFSLRVLPGDPLGSAHFQGLAPAVTNLVNFGLPGHRVVFLAFFNVSQALLPRLETVFKAVVAAGLRTVVCSSPSSLSTACRLPPGRLKTDDEVSGSQSGGRPGYYQDLRSGREGGGGGPGHLKALGKQAVG